MQKKVVEIRKSALGFLFGINIMTAVGIQILLQVMMFIMFKINLNKAVTEEEAREIILKSLYLACGITLAIGTVSAFLSEKTGLLDSFKIRDEEILRAIYSAVIGMIGVCIARTASEETVLQTNILLIIIGCIMVLGNYRLKFQEVRQGAWFPHMMFQLGLQWFLFPLAVHLVGKVIK